MNRLEIFKQHRSRLFAIAYRMLGSVSDTEDILQEAWLRWQLSEGTIQSPKAYLSKIVTRLSIDSLRSARVKREQYIGCWLPEPLLTPHASNLTDQAELAESLSFAFLTLLECLSPTERAVFLLREVFEYSYSEIAAIVDKNEANCRQIFHRARQHLNPGRQEETLSTWEQEALIEQFLKYWRQGDVQSLISLMTEDITFFGDGGGKATAIRFPLQSRFKVARFLVAIGQSRLLPTLTSHIKQVNGCPGIINLLDAMPHSVFSFEFEGKRIRKIFAVVNPEKLTDLDII